MTAHQSNVNYHNLIKDLADMYPFEVTEVVVVELVANSLDAGATLISIDYDPRGKALVVADDGKGMDSSQFAEYHDFAAGLKTRGMGIGFAGVGAKVAFNVAGRVVTETASETFSGGSNWYLHSNKSLVWEDMYPSHLAGHGTRVEVRFAADTRPSYSGSSDLVKLLRRHFLPLFDSEFLMLYARLGYYSGDLRFRINGTTYSPGDLKTSLGLDKIREIFPRRGGKRAGYGFLGLSSSEYVLGADVCGVLLCTRGKVIRADLFNQFPGSLTPKIAGVVEVPGFVDFLTTNKADFLRGRKYRELEGLYGPIREEFKSWLAELGVQPTEIAGTDEATQLERELRKVLEDVPELGDFFGFRTKKPVLQARPDGATTGHLEEGAQMTFPFGNGHGGQGPGPVDMGDDQGQAVVEDKERPTDRATPISRTAKRGPKIGLASAPDRDDLAWVSGNSVLINTGHPSYVKVRSNPLARRHHSLFAIASAVQCFMAGDNAGPTFVDRMMAAWGRK